MAAKWRSRPALDRIVASLDGGATADRGLALLAGVSRGEPRPRISRLEPRGGKSSSAFLEVFAKPPAIRMPPRTSVPERSGCSDIPVFDGDEDSRPVPRTACSPVTATVARGRLRGPRPGAPPGTAEAVAKRWAGYWGRRIAAGPSPCSSHAGNGPPPSSPPSKQGRCRAPKSTRRAATGSSKAKTRLSASAPPGSLRPPAIPAGQRSCRPMPAWRR